VKLRSFAKINLWLRVAGKRTDGYHEIETVFHSVSLHDEVEVTVPNRGVEVLMDVDVDENLVERAAAELRGARDIGARIEIRKNIPIAAGLAGGSGNAAATLIALNRLWRLGLSEDELEAIGLRLGSDVPFQLRGGLALGKGRGERLTSLPVQHLALWFVLGISGKGLSTADVYRERHGASDGPSLDDLRFALDVGEPELIAPAIRNDLEVAALHLRPELADSMTKVEDAGALRAFVSGSGPTIVGIARGEDDARRIAARLIPVFDRVDVARSHVCAVELGG
jgi:4-diphosphocytidyl-2-C-methyl-D-erythritol kinase